VSACITRLWVLIFTRLYHWLYHQLAWCYDFIAWIVSIGKWRQWIRTSLPFLEGQRILELGFGPGHLQEDLARSGANVFGIDESWQMCLVAKRNLQRLIMDGYAHFRHLVRGNVKTLPFASRAFTSVVSTFPSNYIFDPNTLNEISRILSLGGKLVIVLSAVMTGRNPIDRIVGWFFRATTQSVNWQDPLVRSCLNANLHAQFRWIELPSSKILLLIAEKLDNQKSLNDLESPSA
jgi:ubiquinone/menaquinone biosynthesis C-methylase UbiE